MGVEEERDLLAELVHVQPGVHGGLHVGDPIGEGESDFLHGGRPGLADMVAGDADRVPARDLRLAVLEDVGDQAHGGSRREDIGAAGDIFLEDVVLDRAAQFGRVAALAFGDGNVHRQQHGRGGVDRHAGGDLLQRDAVEQGFHIPDRGDRDAHPADLAQGDGVIGVIADLGGQVEGHREAGLPLVEQVAVAAVGFFGGGVPGVLAHGPQAGAVHGWVDAAGVGVLAGEAGLVEVVGIHRGIDRVQRDVRGGGEIRLSAPGIGK